MQHCQPDLFQQLDIEIMRKNSSYMVYMQETLPLHYDRNGKELPLPYEKIKKFLLEGIDWMWYLFNNPAAAEFCDFSRLDEAELTYLLREKPEMKTCVDWKNVLPETKKQLLLAYHPEWAENRKQLDTLSGQHWLKLLCLHPEYHFLAPWDKFTGDYWQALLCKHPDFAGHCDFRLLTIENWEDLLTDQIRFLPFCPAAIRNDLSVEKREELFALYPEIQALW